MADPTLESLRALLDTRCGGLLRSGGHEPPNDPGGDCQVCAEELRCLALDLPWSDHPPDAEITGGAVRILNDAQWSSDQARTEHCLPLALLADADAAPGWVERYVIRTVREILPIALQQAGLATAAARCAAVETLADAITTAHAAADATTAVYAAAYAAKQSAADAYAATYAAAVYAANAAAVYAAKQSAADAYAAAYAADADAAHAAGCAARAATYAAAYAAYAAHAGDHVLAPACRILIECHSGRRFSEVAHG